MTQKIHRKILKFMDSEMGGYIVLICIVEFKCAIPGDDTLI
jgi:hypothetical protein